MEVKHKGLMATVIALLVMVPAVSFAYILKDSPSIVKDIIAAGSTRQVELDVDGGLVQVRPANKQAASPSTAGERLKMQFNLLEASE